MKFSDTVNSAAQGRWVDVLVQLGGLDQDILDTKHHHCPKCGGTDRFRAFNDVQDTGGLICNKCGKFAGGFTSLSWLLGIPFKEAVDKVAEYLNVKKPSGSKPNPDEAVEGRPWNEHLEQIFCSSKKGVTHRGLINSGASMASYRREVVLCWDIFGQDLKGVVGHVLASSWGKQMPIFNKKGEVTGQTKYKLVYGSEPGLIGKHGIERLVMEGMVDRVWKVEGISDLLSAQSILPETSRDVIVTNSNGAKQDPVWMAQALARAKEVIIVHDADEPGQAGATLWAKRCADAGVPVRNVQLPYEIVKDHGKDLRDWLSEGNHWSDLEALADMTPILAPRRGEESHADDLESELAIFKMQLRRLHLDVLYEDDKGRIRIYSAFTKKSSWVNNVDKLGYNQLIQMGGMPVIVGVVGPDERGTSSQLSVSQVKKAIAALGAMRRHDDRERGVGLWRGTDESGDDTRSILVVNANHGARWNGDGVLKRIDSPRDEGLVMDLGAGNRDWFEFEVLARKLESAADKSWRETHLTKLQDFFAQWQWGQDAAPALLVGLVLGSWTQTLWSWRPLVDISGESGSGKSFLFEALAGSDARHGIFGRLGFRSSKSTEAGLRQATRNKAHIILCDEFEASNEREKILLAIRAGSRGDAITRGTAGGESMRFQYQHLVWVAAIETGLAKQADSTRFISLDLLKPQAGRPRIKMPSSRELWEMGQNTLAIAIRTFFDAEDLAARLANDSSLPHDIRTRETFAVPVASLAVALGYSDDQARNMLDAVCQDQRDTQDEVESDHVAVLQQVMNSVVLNDGANGLMTPYRILSNDRFAVDAKYSGTLETCGIRRRGDQVFFHCRTVSLKLLPGREDIALSKLFKRLPGSKVRVQASIYEGSVEGSRTQRTGLSIPWEVIRSVME
ncbi:MAG: primase-helicase zinc-binding domain-containing protein [Pirellulales bacterium]